METPHICVHQYGRRYLQRGVGGFRRKARERNGDIRWHESSSVRNLSIFGRRTLHHVHHSFRLSFGATNYRHKTIDDPAPFLQQSEFCRDCVRRLARPLRSILEARATLSSYRGAETWNLSETFSETKTPYSRCASFVTRGDDMLSSRPNDLEGLGSVRYMYFAPYLQYLHT